MKTVAFVFSMMAVMVVVWAGPQGGYQPPAATPPQYADEPAQYSFQWDVNDDESGNYYGHQEQRDGDYTQGRYYVQLPDGKLLKVEYTVDQYGYHPIITYEGQPQYLSQGYSQPTPAPTPSQFYSQPTPAPTPSQFYSQPTPAPTPTQFYSQPGK